MRHMSRSSRDGLGWLLWLVGEGLVGGRDRSIGALLLTTTAVVPTFCSLVVTVALESVDYAIDSVRPGKHFRCRCNRASIPVRQMVEVGLVGRQGGLGLGQEISKHVFLG